MRIEGGGVNVFVDLFTCLSVLSTRLSISVQAYLFIYLAVYLPTFLSIYQPVYLYLFLPIFPFIY